MRALADEREKLAAPARAGRRDGAISPDVNPWTELPQRPPYILPQDLAELSSHGISPSGLGLDLGLLPVPWIGSLESAVVVLLTLNPSVHDKAREERAEEEELEYTAAIRANLHFGNDPPFLDLDGRFCRQGDYWLRLVSARSGGRPSLVDRIGISSLSRRIGCIQYFPYRSLTYTQAPCDLPSQRYSWDLARRVVAEGKVVVVQRSWDMWVRAVPELAGYPCIRLRNVRSPFLSEGNMSAADWERLLQALSN